MRRCLNQDRLLLQKCAGCLTRVHLGDKSGCFVARLDGSLVLNDSKIILLLLGHTLGFRLSLFTLLILKISFRISQIRNSLLKEWGVRLQINSSGVFVLSCNIDEILVVCKGCLTLSLCQLILSVMISLLLSNTCIKRINKVDNFINTTLKFELYVNCF
jgi:hypothetical protein